jgi:hypothetical protein
MLQDLLNIAVRAEISYRSSSILLFMHTEINGPWDSCFFFPPEVLARDSDDAHGQGWLYWGYRLPSVE